MAFSTDIQAQRKKNENSQQLQLLLETAKREGGAIAEVAEELTHPRRSILATVGNGFKDAFVDFIDVISTPSQIVAGAISPTYTIGEAMKQDITPSQVIMGEGYQGDSKIAKGAEWTARFAIDVLTDPLTYVTFGASAGALGIRALPKFQAGAKTAEKLGVEIGQEVAVSKEGMSLVNKYLDSQRKGLRTQFLKDERNKIAQSNLLKKVSVDEESIAKQLKEISEKTSDELIEQTIGKKLSFSDTLATVSNLLERNPALIETLVDKGGVKFFGKTILEGQRIKAIKNAIPGSTWLDNITMPVRNKVNQVFNTDYIAPGYVNPQLAALKKSLLDNSRTAKSEFTREIDQVFRKSGITEAETKMITSAIQASKRPADQKLAALYDAAHGLTPSPDAQLAPELINALKFSKNQVKQNYKQYLASGKSLHAMDNYFPNMTVKTKLQNVYMPKNVGKAQAPAFSRTAGLAKFIDQAGNESIGFGEFIGKGADQQLEITIPKKGLEPTKMILDKTKEGTWKDFVSDTEIKRIRVAADEANNFFKGQDIDLQFEENALALLTKNSFDVINYTAQKDFLSDFAKIAGKPANEAPVNWKPLNLTELELTDDSMARFLNNKAGQPLVFHPAVAEWAEKGLIGISKGDPSDEIFESFDNLTNFFKASVTSIWPAFHGRNAISNVFMSMMDIGLHALNPAYNIQSAQLNWYNRGLTSLENKVLQGKFAPPESALFKAASEAQDKIFELNSKTFMKDSTGRSWTVGELRAVMKKNVVAYQPEVGGMFDYTKVSQSGTQDMYKYMFKPETKGGQVKRQASNILNPKNVDRNPLFKGGRAVANTVEDQARAMHFLVNLKNTGSVELAAQRTKQFLFDYSNITDFERKVLKRIMPFYTFFRKNMEQQVKTMIQSPGRMAMQVKALETLGDTMESGRLTEEERKNLPLWMQDGINIIRSRSGQNLEIMGNVGTPIEAAFDMAQPSSVLGSVNPFIKLPVEWMSGYSFFYEKGIDEVNNASAFKSAPEALKDFIGFTEVTGTRSDGTEYSYYVSLRPERMYLLSNLPGTSRVFSTFKQMESVDVSDQAKLIQFLLGQKAYSFDMEVEAERREKELTKELQRKLSAAGVGYTFERYVTEKQ